MENVPSEIVDALLVIGGYLIKCVKDWITKKKRKPNNGGFKNPQDRQAYNRQNRK